MIRMGCKLTVLAAALLASAATAARADSIQITNVPDPYQKGSFTGSIDYDAAHTLLTISLTNTTAASLGGYITAFLFDINGAQDATLTKSTINGVTTTGFHGFNNVNAAPYGTFEEGVSLGSKANSDFADGGKPSNGIAAGKTGTFTFKITGTGAGSLSADDFLNQPVGSFELPFFAVRYRGFGDGSSSKLLGYQICVPSTGGGDTVDPLPPGPVPVPASVYGGAALMLALSVARWRTGRTAPAGR